MYIVIEESCSPGWEGRVCGDRCPRSDLVIGGLALSQGHVLTAYSSLFELLVQIVVIPSIY